MEIYDLMTSYTNDLSLTYALNYCMTELRC